LEQLIVAHSVMKEIFTEVLDTKYEPRLNELYCDEEKIIQMLDLIVQTPIYRGFQWMYGIDLHNVENIPNRGGAMLVSNHATPYLGDVAPLYFGIFEKRRRAIYGLGHKLLKKSDFIKTIGGTFGTRDTAVKLLEDDKLTLVCPGGIMDACKPWYHCYKVRPVEGFSDSGLGYLKAAYMAKKPIIPVGNIGAEESILILADIKEPIGRFLRYMDDKIHFGDTVRGKTIFHLWESAKIIPLAVTPPMRTKVDAYIGNPIDVNYFLGSNPSQGDFAEVNRIVMAQLQSLIDVGLKEKPTLISRIKREIGKYVE
ncbi:MAG: 1-acyl-sn-glycerol-3-phosphate acyltransferase, partial [Nanoarchaeota archaeon]